MVLLKSKTKIVSYTKCIDESMSPGEYIAYVARVSNPSNQSNHLTAPKLLRFLLDHKHVSPFQMVDVTFEIETTRDIGRQILRHLSFSFQEFSQRYADPGQLGFVLREARLQDVKNRQNSIEVFNPELQMGWEAHQIAIISATTNAYDWAIKNGIAKEQARAVLPEGLTLSRMYMKGSIRSWIHYAMVRCDPSTQKEHRIVAGKIWKKLLVLMPELSVIEIPPMPDGWDWEAVEEKLCCHQTTNE
jgi:thymidylate synthase (FAD)